MLMGNQACCPRGHLGAGAGLGTPLVGRGMDAAAWGEAGTCVTECGQWTLKSQGQLRQSFVDSRCRSQGPGAGELGEP